MLLPSTLSNRAGRKTVAIVAVADLSSKMPHQMFHVKQAQSPTGTGFGHAIGHRCVHNGATAHPTRQAPTRTPHPTRTRHAKHPHAHRRRRRRRRRRARCGEQGILEQWSAGRSKRYWKKRKPNGSSVPRCRSRRTSAMAWRSSMSCDARGAATSSISALAAGSPR